MRKSVLIPFDRYQYYKSLANDRRPIDPTSEDRPSVTEEIVPHEEHLEQPTFNRLHPNIILSQLPKRNRTKALSILNALEQHPTLDWNKQGEIIVNGSEIPYSHISDILHDALNVTRRTEPIGCQEFYSNLGHFPQSLITNPNRRTLINRGSIVKNILDSKVTSSDDWGELWKSE